MFVQAGALAGGVQGRFPTVQQPVKEYRLEMCSAAALSQTVV